MLSHIRFTKDGRNLISVAQDAQRMFIWDFYGDANPLQIKGSNNESDVKIIQEESLDDLNILGDVKQKR